MGRQEAWKSRRPARSGTQARAATSHGRPRPHREATVAADPSTSTRSQVRGMIAGLLATVTVLGLGSVAFVMWIGGQSDEAVPAPGPPPVTPASTFRVVYRLDDMAGSAAQVE